MRGVVPSGLVVVWLAFVALLATLAVGACGGSRGDVLVRDGVEHAQRGEADEARMAFQKALVATPGAPGARTGLAVLTKDPAKARALLDKELDSHPALGAARFDRALLALATGTPEDAKRAADDLATLPADDAEAQKLLAIARFMAGASDTVPPELVGVTTSSAEAQTAWQAFKDGAPGSSAVPEAILALSPRLRAAVLAKAGRWEEALAALPVQPETALDRAIALAWLDRLDEARALVAEALRRDASDARAQALGAVLATRGD
ncbi:MAG: hypothetical protein U1F43_25475 [Myxococcota bacterium]